MRSALVLGSVAIAALTALAIVPLEAVAQAQTAASPSAGGRSASVRNATKGVVVPPALEDIEAMCALLTGCADVAFPKPGEDVVSCVKASWQALASADTVRLSLGIRDCALRANSCGELRECALAGASPDVCNGRAMKSDEPIGFCDLDGRAVSCFRGKPLFVRDCPRAGEQCSVAGGKPICSLGSCPADMAEGASQCSANGQRVLRCQDRRLQSRDCSVLGLRCATSNGKPVCVPVTKSCTTASVHRCDGKAAVACLDGHEVRVLCDAARMSCVSPNDTRTNGVCALLAPARPEKCVDGRPRCVGNAIEYCFG
ncbi:MAG: hypothetical protein MUF54_20960, partial [Polyangiaceae bacterium]|nr:hypothetical protein [Polyangiaceae bacterium]